MARAKKQGKEKELTLEDALFACRNALRGVGSLEKNRDAVISLVFLRFAGDKFEKRRAELMEEYGDIPSFLEKPSFYNAANVFYLEEESRWSYLVKHASANDIAIKIDRAMALAEEKNPSLKGALPLNHFSTLGAEVRSIKALIDAINQISEKRYQEEDLIGRVYEYFLQTFAVGATKEDGEFYTPACVVQFIAEMIEPYEGVVYDPCCGSGGMFVQSTKFVEKHNGNMTAISVVGQESNPDTWRLCKMNLAIRGIAHNLGEEAKSTFTNDQHKDKKVDYIMANPPFNLKNWRDEDELTDDARWKGYTTPPVSNANYAWILHMLSKLDVNHGIAGFLLANGALNADGDEGAIRQKLLENDKVEAIIVLPRDMFYTTDISVTLWIVNMNKKAGVKNGRKLRDRCGEVLFMDLRTWNENIETYTYEKGKRKKKTVFTSEQMEKAKTIYSSWQEEGGDYRDIPELCASVALNQDGGIREKGFSLAPSAYVEFIDHDSEINAVEEIPNVRKSLLELLQEQKRCQEKLESTLTSISECKNDSDQVTRYRLGDLVQVVDERNSFGIDRFMGINIEKEFMPTAANTDGLDATKYKVVRKHRFVYSGMQTGRDICIRISMFNEDEPVIVSPAYTTFEVCRTDVLDPMFLYMMFMSSEKDRLGWFCSDSSIRANLDWPVFCDFMIELPPLSTQKEYAQVYGSLLDGKRVLNSLTEKVKGICPVLVQGALM